jgi:hypothetical protein
MMLRYSSISMPLLATLGAHVHQRASSRLPAYQTRPRHLAACMTLASRAVLRSNAYAFLDLDCKDGFSPCRLWVRHR